MHHNVIVMNTVNDMLNMKTVQNCASSRRCLPVLLKVYCCQLLYLRCHFSAALCTVNVLSIEFVQQVEFCMLYVKTLQPMT